MLKTILYLTFQRLFTKPFKALLLIMALVSMMTVYLVIGQAMVNELVQVGIEPWRSSAIWDLIVAPKLHGGEIESEQIAALPEIARLDRVMSYNIWLEGSNVSIKSLDEEQMSALILAQGTTPQSPNDIVISDYLAKHHDVVCGDTLALTLIWKSNDTAEYTVCGILPAGSSADWMVFGSEAGVLRLNQGLEPSTVLGIKLSPDANMESVSRAIKKRLPANDVITYMGVRLAENSSPSVATFIGDLLGGMISLVTALMVLIFSYFNYREHRREAGVLMAIGANNAWLTLVSVLSTACLFLIALIVLYLFLPLMNTAFMLELPLHTIGFLSLATRLKTLGLVSLVITVIYDLSTWRYSIAQVLSDDWLS